MEITYPKPVPLAALPPDEAMLIEKVLGQCEIKKLFKTGDQVYHSAVCVPRRCLGVVTLDNQLTIISLDTCEVIMEAHLTCAG